MLYFLNPYKVVRRLAPSEGSVFVVNSQLNCGQVQLLYVYVSYVTRSEKTDHFQLFFLQNLVMGITVLCLRATSSLFILATLQRVAE